MEMPINIIIILFVALVVGGAIIAFSQSTLNRAQEDLNEWRDDPAKKDLIVEVAAADDDDIISLANACAAEHQGTVDQTVCFALFAESFTADWETLDGKELAEGFTLDTSAVTGTPTAVRIAYSPAGKIIVS